MERKKILHIVEAFGGGIFSFLVDLINNTDEEYDITIAYSKREQTPENFKEYFKKSVKFIEVKSFKRSIDLKNDIKVFFEVKKIIKEINPDIIHLHSSKAGFIGRFAANGKKIKMLYNPHGFSFLMQNLSKFKRMIYWLIEKIAAIRKCTVIGCSYGEYIEAKKITRNAICINNGINIKMIDSLINKSQNEFDFKNIKICTSGRIGFQKNPQLFNEIAKKFPEVEFTWIGAGDLECELTSSNIRITGWKSREENIKILNDNDIFILTSLWEGLPISLLEAMYLGKICVVTDCIGNKDVIKHNENGYIAHNLNDFEQIIKQIISGKKDISLIIKNELNDVNEKFNVTEMVNQYKKEYL